jgi:hypothetical protein
MTINYGGRYFLAEDWFTDAKITRGHLLFVSKIRESG